MAIHRSSRIVLRSGGDRPGDHHREWQPGVAQAQRRSVSAALLDGQRMESAMAQAFADLLDRRSR